jgi:hypothetical protein
MRLTRSRVTLLAATTLLGCGETTSADATPADSFDAGAGSLPADTTARAPAAVMAGAASKCAVQAPSAPANVVR